MAVAETDSKLAYGDDFLFRVIRVLVEISTDDVDIGR